MKDFHFVPRTLAAAWLNIVAAIIVLAGSTVSLSGGHRGTSETVLQTLLACVAVPWLLTSFYGVRLALRRRDGR